jgi:hypothetical protein
VFSVLSHLILSPPFHLSLSAVFRHLLLLLLLLYANRAKTVKERGGGETSYRRLSIFTDYPKKMRALFARVCTGGRRSYWVLTTFETSSNI